MAKKLRPTPAEKPDYLGILLVGRTGQGKSTTGNKLLQASDDWVIRGGNKKRFDVGGRGVSCTREVQSGCRRGTKQAKPVHVIDTPGFADSDTTKALGVFEGNLAMFRDLIRRQVNHNLRIHRVLYFLPHRGPLEVADGVLQEEIEVMHHFFGNAIFNCMVLVATLHEDFSSLKFSKKHMESTRDVFEGALKLANLEDDPPLCPPVIFIGHDDNGVDIQRRIESADVISNEGLLFDKFVLGTCTKCAMKYICRHDNISDPEKRLGVLVRVKSEEKEGMKERFVRYESSKCHPLLIPKYSYWERVVGGVGHLATLGIPMLIGKLRKGEIPWPTFTSKDEQCQKCDNSPGSKGCTEVHSEYQASLPTGESEKMLVDHSNKLLYISE